MVRRLSWMLFVGTSLSVGSVSVLSESNLASQKQALDVIADFADRICDPAKVPLVGSSSSLELSGKAKAELSELVKKVANVGVEGAAKYQSSKYANVLQKDLVAVLRENKDCRLKVFEKLQSRLLAPASAKKSSQEARATGGGVAVNAEGKARVSVSGASNAGNTKPGGGQADGAARPQGPTEGNASTATADDGGVAVNAKGSAQVEVQKTKP